MTVVDDVSTWIQNLLKTSKSYSNKFYYDGHGVIVNYEESIKVQKDVIENVEKRRKLTEEIHKKRMEKQTLFTPLYEDINRLELEKYALESQVAENKLSHDGEILIILKNLVGLSKITDALIRELPQSERTKKILEDFRQFQLDSEPTIYTLKEVLDEKLKDSDKENSKHK